MEAPFCLFKRPSSVSRSLIVIRCTGVPSHWLSAFESCEMELPNGKYTSSESGKPTSSLSVGSSWAVERADISRRVGGYWNWLSSDGENSLISPSEPIPKRVLCCSFWLGLHWLDLNAFLNIVLFTMLAEWIVSRYRSLKVSLLSSCPTVYRDGGFEISKPCTVELPNLANVEACNLTRRHCSRTFGTRWKKRQDN